MYILFSSPWREIKEPTQTPGKKRIKNFLGLNKNENMTYLKNVMQVVQEGSL